MPMKLTCSRCDGTNGVKPIEVLLKSTPEATLATVVTAADLCDDCYPKAVERIKAAFAPPVPRAKKEATP